MRHLHVLEAIAGALLLGAILTAALAACDDEATGSGDATSDAGGDLGLDLNPDTTADTAPDTTPDATPDATPDTTPDATPDTTPDATPDTPADTGGDPSADAVDDAIPDAPACNADFTSNLGGVRILVDASRCAWTLAQAAAGIEIGYDIVIDADVDDVRAGRQDAGGCGTPDDSGLIPFERVGDGGDNGYCLCDVGLCMGEELPIGTLDAGTYAHTFQWDGRNFAGPSDTGNEPGDPFPAGTYVFSVSAVGEHGVGVDAVPFEVEGTLEMTLAP